MLTDRYGLELSTASTTARDAYVQATDLALNSIPAHSRRMTGLSPPTPFSMAHAGKAVLMRQAMLRQHERRWWWRRMSLPPLPEREASHIGLFELVFAGRTDAAIDAMSAHLKAWPCDTLVVSSGANPNGLIGGSGRMGQKHQIAERMDGLAPHYGDDYWFMAYHAMALSEDGRLAEARAKIRRSIRSAHGAHGFAHVCYESGEPDTARAYLRPWLATYPRDGFFDGHLSWPLSLCEIQAGNWDEAVQLYLDALTLDRHGGGPQQKMSDGARVFVAFRTRRASSRSTAWPRLHEYERCAAAAGQRARRFARDPGASRDPRLCQV